ncbi:hypothetical protein Tco_0852655 [Tanacetum coccineum]
MVINSPCLTDKKELAIPGQTATGKEFSNPLMANSLPKTIINGKAVVITESSVRNDLLFDDEDGITCLTNEEIFENLALIGQKSLLGKVTLLFESMLVQNQAPEGESSVTSPEPQPSPSTSQPNVSEPQTKLHQIKTPPTVSHEPQIEANIEKILPSPSIYQRKHRKTQTHRRAKKVTELPQTTHDSDNIVRTQTTAMPNVDIPQGMDTGGNPSAKNMMLLLLRLGLRECLNRPNEPPLPEGHTSRSKEGRMAYTFELMDIIPRTPHDSPLLGVESSDDDLDEEDASKQGRKSDKTKQMFKDSDFDVLDDDMENVEEILLGYLQCWPVDYNGYLEGLRMVNKADTLIAIRQTRTRPSYLPRPTSVVITDTEQGQRRLTTPPPSQPSDTRDKGKDAELAQLLHQEELAQVERRQRERAAQEEASIAVLYEEYDTIQASIDADALFAVRLQQE